MPNRAFSERQYCDILPDNIATRPEKEPQNVTKTKAFVETRSMKAEKPLLNPYSHNNCSILKH